ncbi:MAG: tetratricopeptide repeat protein [Candidatus Cloacimonetes bacterium]|nr:tetratricopeptide repeat protein [Candidatus Cloacimonadota bacterium]
MKISSILILLSLFWIVSADFRFASELYQDGLYEEAIREFEKAIEISPTTQEAAQSMLLIAECYREIGDLTQAEIYYRRLWDGYPNFTAKDLILFNYAQVQFQSGKYREAVSNFQRLVSDYPLSEYSKKALLPIVQSFFYQEDYNQVILQGNRFSDNYAGIDDIPDILLYMVRSYYKNGMPEEGRTVLNRIRNEYPRHNARWEALELELAIIRREQGLEAAIIELSSQLAENIPRQFEETLRLKLLYYYIEVQNYRAAQQEANKIISKFDNSENLDLYRTILTRCRMLTGDYVAILDDFNPEDRILRKSIYRIEYILLGAEAYFNLGNNEQALILIDSTLDEMTQGEMHLKALLLKADILVDDGRLQEAIELYQQVLKIYGSKQDEIYFKLGEINHKLLRNPGQAEKYYNQIILNHPSSPFIYRAMWERALCLEKLRKYDLTLQLLQEIDLQNLNDEQLKEEIIARRKYIYSYRMQNLPGAIEKLLISMLQMTSDQTSSEKLQYQIVEVLAEELKEYEEALNLLEMIPGKEASYQRAKLSLRLAEKARLQGDPIALQDYVQRAERETMEFDEVLDQQMVSEINILTQLVLSDSVSEILAQDIELFLDQYPEVTSRNQFLLLLAEYYFYNHQEKSAITVVSRLSKDSTVDENRYYDVMINMGEYFYSIDDDQNARKYYEIARERIDLNRPEIFFHFAVVLAQTGDQENAMQMLELLVNNRSGFSSFRSALNYYARNLVMSGQIKKAVTVRLKLPEKQRDDSFYLSLYDDYLQLGDKIKARESLMHIQEKDDGIMVNLARLHYETGDLIMAELTYQELSKRNPGTFEYLEKLGHIAFLRKEYSQSVEYYDRSNKLITTPESGNNIYRNLAKEFTIALYMTGNRPKAEEILKRFKPQLSDALLQEIKMYEGIYFRKIDPGKAEKIFSGIIRDKNASADLIDQAYFWRGTTNLENNEITKAEEDFLLILNSNDPDLLNNTRLKLGTIKFTQEDYPQALQYYYSVIENDESGQYAIDAASNFAYVCKTIEEWQKAITAYEIILNKWGDTGLESKTLFDIAYCHYRDKKFRHAIDMFEKALSLLEDNEIKAEAQYWIGESYYGLEEFRKAVTEFLKVSYSYPDYIQWAAAAELRAAESYVTIADLDKAKRLYQRITEKYGAASQWGKEAKVRLDLLN